MKVTVLGAGVVGVTSAYYLAKAGHEVTVIERQPGAALETSYANAGEISPGYASPWAAPGIPMKAVKWLLMSPILIDYFGNFVRLAFLLPSVLRDRATAAILWTQQWKYALVWASSVQCPTCWCCTRCRSRH